MPKRRETTRSLPSPRVQEKKKLAHEAVVDATMKEDDRAAVVKPSCLVQQVSPNEMWPDGGVVVYAQLPFLLDLSWKQSRSWVALCRQAVCAPDGASQGGTYEVCVTLKKVSSGGIAGSPGDTLDRS